MIDLLAATLESNTAVRTDAEQRLEQLYTTEAFPVSLVSIASHTSLPIPIRQASLISMKNLVLKTWSPSLEEFQGPVSIGDATKDRLRQAILALATSGDPEQKIIGAASNVVSKIASADFPEAWPSLLPNLLQLVPQTHEAQLHGVLVVLGNLVEEGFDEGQFWDSAVGLVKCIYNVAIDGTKKLTSRALAVSIFRACFDAMEAVFQQTYQPAVEQFMLESSEAWLPVLIEILKSPLPYVPSDEEEAQESDVASNWRGFIALKTQAVKVCNE